MNAPPRNTVAPTPFTLWATSKSCSRDSTEHGPAITTTRGPPTTTSSTTTRVGSARISRLASLNGCRIGATLSTHSSDSSARRRSLARSSPIAPTTVRSSPRIVWARYPIASMRRQTSAISSSLA